LASKTSIDCDDCLFLPLPKGAVCFGSICI
jgi:hypothetical protein